MQTYFIQDKFGLAVINATSREEALHMLKEKEKTDDCIALSHLATVDDVKPLQLTTQGIVIYFVPG